jgi:phosphatidylinositol kinase/protein kinase (PI-3  family)
MVHTLRALRSSKELLLNMMDVFVKEPALDWKVREGGEEMGERGNEVGRGIWGRISWLSRRWWREMNWREGCR